MRNGKYGDTDGQDKLVVREYITNEIYEYVNVHIRLCDVIATLHLELISASTQLQKENVTGKIKEKGIKR